MKQTLPIGRALLIAAIAIVIYILVIFNTPQLDSYFGMAMFFSTPLVFAGVVVWCYILLFLERKQIMAPHLFFRFSIPFLFFSLLFWVCANVGNDPLISAFQQYTFAEYMDYFLDFMKNALLILGSLFFVMATLFTLLVKQEQSIEEIRQA